MLPRGATFVLLATLIGCIDGDLTCRSGINTTIYGFPIRFWDEADRCSTSSSQSCFIGELEFDVNLQNDNLTLTYGSCISTAYKAYLGCDEIFSTPRLPITQLLNAFLPDIQNVVDNGIKTFSEDAAMTIQTFLKNENGELDNLRIVEELVTTLLRNLNRPMPSNAGTILSKLDTLILTAMLNVSKVSDASRDLLLSFGSLNTSDDASSKLLYDFFRINGIAVPIEFTDVIENLPGFIMQYVKNDPSYQIFNQTMFHAISSIDTSNVTTAVSGIARAARLILPGIVNSDFDLLPIFDTVSNLMMQVMEGKQVSDLDIWRLDLLTHYSRTSSVSRSFSSAIINFISTVLPGQLLEGWVTLINAVPGYLYMFTNNTVELDRAFVAITNYLNLYQESEVKLSNFRNNGKVNVSSIDLQAYIEFAMSVLDASANFTTMSQDLTSNNTNNLENSIINALSELNIIVPMEYHPAIQNIPRLLLLLLNQQQMNGTAVIELRNLLLSGDLSLDTTMLALSNMIPVEYNLRTFVTSLPNLINILTRGNLTAINKWQMDLIKAYGRTTQATQAFSNAVFEYLKIAGVFEFITEDLKTMIEYYPGYLYNFFPPEIVPQIDRVLYNISEALISSDLGISITLSNTLQSYSINTSDPILFGVIKAIDSILNLSRAKNITDLGREALMSLKRVSFITNRTSSFVASFRNLLHSLNVSIPSEYDEVMDYTPGLIITLIPGYEEYVNNIFRNVSVYINAFDMSNPNFDSIFEFLASLIPQEYNLNRFVKSLPSLMSQFTLGNFEYVNEWQIQLLIEYSRITTATEAISNSTLELFQRVGMYEHLPKVVFTLVRYYPGYIYNFIPPTLTPQFELALHQIADILKISQLGNQVNIESILSSFALNTSEPALQVTVTVLQRILNLGSSRNMSELGFKALNSLKESSLISNDTAVLSSSFLKFLQSFNVSMPTEYEEVVRHVPGIFLTLFPQYKEIISQIISNASLFLNDFDPNDYNSAFATLRTLIPAEYNLQLLIDSFPSLLEELTAGNISYLNTWSLHLLKTYSRVTPATETLANATLDFITGIGYNPANLTSDFRMLIDYIPGHLYNFFPDNMIGQLERALYNISDILYLNDGDRSVSTSEVLQSFSLNTSDPAVFTLTSIMDSVMNIADARNVTELGKEALSSLQSVSHITNESRTFSDSFIYFLQQFNITIPNSYKNMTRNLVGLLTVILPDQREVINTIFLNTSQILDASLANGVNLEAAIDILQSVTPQEYNLHLFMDSLPMLISQLTAGNFPYINQWQADVLNAYSITTPATELFYNSTVGFLTRAGIYNYLPESQKALLSNYIGYIYYFIPGNMTNEVEYVLRNVSDILKISEPGHNVDLQEIFASFSLDVTDPRVQSGLSLLNSITNLASVTNLTQFGIQALESLKRVSALNEGTKMLSDSILGIVRQFGVVVPDEYGLVVEYSLGLFNGLFQEQEDLIRTIFSNVSEGFKTFNLTSPKFSSLVILNTFIPEEYKLRPFINSIPSLLEEVTKENFAYINEWSVNLMTSYSNVTVASEQLSYSLLSLLDRYGLPKNVTSELEIFIRSFPGLIYNIVPSDMIPQVDTALSNAADMLNLTDASVEINILDILDSYSLNITDAGLRQSLSSLNSVLNIARSNTLMEFAKQSLASLKMFSTVTNETTDLAESVTDFLQGLNVTLLPEFQDAIRHIPSLLITILPDQRAVITNSVINISQILQSFNVIRPNFEPVIMLIQGFVPAEYNLDNLLLSLPSLLDALIVGNFEYANVWQINLLVEYSSITPATKAIANATIQLLQRWNIYNSIDPQLQRLIQYYPGYFYQILPPALIPQYELALQGIAEAVSLADPTKDVEISEIFSSFSFNMTSPGIGDIVNLLDSISNIAAARNLTDLGKEALASLQTVAVPTNVTRMSSIAIFQFLQQLNLTLPQEYYQIVLGTTSLLFSAVPEQTDLINSVVMNISSILSQTNPMNPDFTVLFVDLIKLVPEEYNLRILLQSIPELLNQVVRGNFNYVNIWQLDVMKRYSTLTGATESIYNSIVALIGRLGMNAVLTEEVVTLIRYYPGYFYNFVGNNTAILDTVLYTLSTAIDAIVPTQTVDIQPLLESFNANFTSSADSQLILGLNSIVNATTSTNLQDFRARLVDSLKNIATITSTSQILSESVVDFFNRINATYDEEYEVLITHLPAIFQTMFPQYRETIDDLYVKAAINFALFDTSSLATDSANTSFAIQQIFNDTMNLLKTANVFIPSDILGLVSLLQEILEDVVVQQSRIEEWIARLPFMTGQVNANSSQIFTSTINQLGLGTSNISSNATVNIVLQYLPQILYLSNPENESLLQIISNTVSDTLATQKMAANQLLVNVATDLLRDVPPVLRPLILSLRDLIPVIISNDQSAITEWINAVANQHCLSNRTVVVEFANSMTKYLEKMGLMVPAYTNNLFKCAPEMMYILMPNQSEIIDNALRMAVLANANYSAYVKEMASLMSFDLSADFNQMLDLLPSVQSALFTFNMTELTSALLQFQDTILQNTQLGNLTVEMLRRFGLDIADETKQIISQIFSYDIFSLFAALNPSAEVFLSSVTSSLQAREDFGIAFLDAFSYVNVTVSPRYTPFFSKIEPLIGGIVKNDMDIVNQAVLDILNLYNASFPSYEVEYAINQYKLQMILQKVNSTYIPKEAFIHVEYMYELFLKMSNLSESILKDTIIQAYPDAKDIIDVIFRLQPRDSFRFVYNVTTWIFTGDRNVSVLSPYIKTIIDIFFEGQNFNVADLLISLTKPIESSCKYETCETDICNTYDLFIPSESSTASTTQTSISVTTAGPSTETSFSTTQIATTQTSTSGTTAGTSSSISATSTSTGSSTTQISNRTASTEAGISTTTTGPTNSPFTSPAESTRTSITATSGTTQSDGTTTKSISTTNNVDTTTEVSTILTTKSTATPDTSTTEFSSIATKPSTTGPQTTQTTTSGGQVSTLCMGIHIHVMLIFYTLHRCLFF